MKAETVTYHVRYTISSINEVWDWRAFPTPQEAWDSFNEYPPRVAASRDPILIKTTNIKIEEEIN